MTSGVMYVCGGASICDWNGHSWGDCDHVDDEPCACADGPCRYCGQDREQAAARQVEFLRELEASR